MDRSGSNQYAFSKKNDAKMKCRERANCPYLCRIVPPQKTDICFKQYKWILFKLYHKWPNLCHKIFSQIANNLKITLQRKEKYELYFIPVLYIFNKKVKQRKEKRWLCQGLLAQAIFSLLAAPVE